MMTKYSPVGENPILDTCDDGFLGSSATCVLEATCQTLIDLRGLAVTRHSPVGEKTILCTRAGFSANSATWVLDKRFQTLMEFSLSSVVASSSRPFDRTIEPGPLGFWVWKWNVRSTCRLATFQTQTAERVWCELTSV